jgi:CubicO group peptidase (beta-lactamase class C family)
MKNIQRFLIIFFLFLIAFLPLPLLAEDFSTFVPLIDRFIVNEMDAALVPGIGLAITKDGAIAYLKGYGDAKPGVPVDPDTRFLLGSVSKGMTAMGLMCLVDEGKIDPEATVVTYLPGFVIADPRTATITVKELLTHTSGISFIDGRVPLTEQKERSLSDLMRNTAALELTATPGTRFQYSNWNYILAGRIIEAVSEKKFAQFLKERVFDPIGMTLTTAGRDTEGGTAIGSRSFLGFPLRGAIDYPDGVVPAAFIISTPRDMAAYLCTIQRQGIAPNDRRVISSSAISTMTTKQTPTGYYGYGWFVVQNGISHGGDTAEFRAQADIRWINGASYGIAILFLKNDYVTPMLSYQDSFQYRIPEGIQRILTIGKDPGLPASKAGFYRLMYSGAAIFIILLLILSIVSIRGWIRPRPANTAGRIIIRVFGVLFAICFQIALPLLIIIFLPLFAGANWRLLLVFVPDVGWLLGGFAVLELGIGLFKGALIIKRLMQQRNTKILI